MVHLTDFLQYYSLDRNIINLDTLINSESYLAIINDELIDYLFEKEIVYILNENSHFLWLNELDSLNLVKI
ncbi:MAG: hypothetical protein ACFFAN_18845 [Promethearchaeota archaeon]